MLTIVIIIMINRLGFFHEVAYIININIFKVGEGLTECMQEKEV